MSDLTVRGDVHVIAMKKSGSSMFSRAFNEYDQIHIDGKPRYVALIRHPAARLVSCWNHLVDRTEHNPCYGPQLPFRQWVDWVLETPDESLDHHVHAQSWDLYHRVKDAPRGSRLWLGQLEQISQNESILSDFVRRPVSCAKSHVHRHAPWPEFYDRKLLEAVRRRFRGDMALWLLLYPRGWWRNHPSILLKDDIEPLIYL